MENIKKLVALLRDLGAASAEYLADAMTMLFLSGKSIAEVANAMTEREGDFPQWTFSEKDGKLRGDAVYYPAAFELGLGGFSTWTVGGHGVSGTIGATGDVLILADGTYSSRFWGDAMEGEDARRLRSVMLQRKLAGEEPPTRKEREGYFLRYSMADTVGRGIRNVLVRMAKHIAETESKWEDEAEDLRHIDDRISNDVRLDLCVWGQPTEADVETAVKAGEETYHRLQAKAKAEAVEAWHRACEAAHADRKNIPGTRAWRRHQRRLGIA